MPQDELNLICGLGSQRSVGSKGFCAEGACDWARAEETWGAGLMQRGPGGWAGAEGAWALGQCRGVSSGVRTGRTPGSSEGCSGVRGLEGILEKDSERLYT